MSSPPNKVSLWIGNVESEEALKNLILERYDDEGDSTSDFMDSFEIEFIDNQFQEVHFYDNTSSKTEILNGFSYIDSFLEEIPEINWEENNCLVLLYNFKYHERVQQKRGLTFVGSYEFTED